MKVSALLASLGAAASLAAAAINITTDVLVTVPASRPPFSMLMNAALVSL